LIAEELEALKKDGFRVVDSYLDLTQTNALLASLADIGRTGSESAERVKRGVVFARRNLLSMTFVQQFVSSAAVRSVMNRVGPVLVPVRAILFDKTGDANWTVPWHQDRSIAVRERVDVAGFGPWSEKAGVVHVQPPVELLRRMVTLRFSLDACGPEQGPLRVVPATHHRLLGPHEVERAVDVGPQRMCSTAAGGLVIMRPLLLHASSPARQAWHRRVLHIEFGPPALPSGLRWAMT
jgi:hypothetical protein